MNREYNIFRWYRAGWARYTQADPLGHEGGLNSYAYGAGNPVLLADPFGLYTVVSASSAERARFEAAMQLLQKELAKDKCGECKKYFSSQPHLNDLDQWVQPGGPPYLNAIARPSAAPSDAKAYSQKGAPWTYSWFFKDNFPPSRRALSPCDLASLILHEIGHLARQDTTDNEPSDFFKACKFGCVNPGRWR